MRVQGDKNSPKIPFLVNLSPKLSNFVALSGTKNGDKTTKRQIPYITGADDHLSP